MKSYYDYSDGEDWLSTAMARRYANDKEHQDYIQSQLDKEELEQSKDWMTPAAQGYSMFGAPGAIALGGAAALKGIDQQYRADRKKGKSALSAIGHGLFNTFMPIDSVGKALPSIAQAGAVGQATDGKGMLGNMMGKSGDPAKGNLMSMFGGDKKNPYVAPPPMENMMGSQYNDDGSLTEETYGSFFDNLPQNRKKPQGPLGK